MEGSPSDSGKRLGNFNHSTQRDKSSRLDSSESVDESTIVERMTPCFAKKLDKLLEEMSKLNGKMDRRKNSDEQMEELGGTMQMMQEK